MPPQTPPATAPDGAQPPSAQPGEGAPEGSFTRTWSVLSGGQLLQLGLGFASSVIIARALGPATFGTYALIGSVATLGHAVCDLGLTSVGVRAVASHWPERSAEAGGRLLVFLAIRLLLATVVTGVALLLAAPIMGLVSQPPVAPDLFRLALLGVLCAALGGVANAVLQATRSFARLSAAALVNPALTLLLALWLRATGQLTLVTTLVVLGIVPSLIATAGATALAPRALLAALVQAGRTLRPRMLLAEGLRMAEQGKLIGLTTTLSLGGAHADLWIIGNLSSRPELGLYALALNLTRKLSLVARSLHTLMLPSIARLQGGAELWPYLRKALLRTAALAVVTAAALPLAPAAIRLVFGDAYAGAGLYVFGLAAVALLELLLTPPAVMLEGIGATRVLALTEAVRLLGVLVPALLYRHSATALDVVRWKLFTALAAAALLATATALRLRGQRRP